MRIVLLLLIAVPCFAQTDQSVMVACDPPTTNVDGSPITEEIEFRFYRAEVSGGPYEQVGESGSCAFEDAGLARGGTYYWVATAVVDGEESGYSNEASETMAGPVPMPPSNLVVAGDLTAYSLVLSRNRVAFVPVGQVAPDTKCDNSQPVGVYHVVPRESVTFAGGVQPQVVVAACRA